MESSLSKWFPSIESLIVALFALAALTVALRLMRRPYHRPMEMKLLGSVMVIALAFAANHPVIYGLAVLVVAILITNLNFLEKLGVLFGRQKPHFQYLLQEATQEEIHAKRESLFDQHEGSGETKWHPDTFLYRDRSWTMGQDGGLETKEAFLADTDRFHSAVHRALREGKGPFGTGEVRENQTLSDRFSQLTYDVIVAGPHHHYIVEIRNLQLRDDLKNNLPEVERMVMAYRGYLSERNDRAGVTPIVIVPRRVNVSNVFLGMLVLKFDLQTNQFHNEERAVKILEAWEKAGI